MSERIGGINIIVIIQYSSADFCTRYSLAKNLFHWYASFKANPPKTIPFDFNIFSVHFRFLDVQRKASAITKETPAAGYLD